MPPSKAIHFVRTQAFTKTNSGRNNATGNPATRHQNKLAASNVKLVSTSSLTRADTRTDRARTFIYRSLVDGTLFAAVRGPDRAKYRWRYTYVYVLAGYLGGGRPNTETVRRRG